MTRLFGDLSLLAVSALLLFVLAEVLKGVGAQKTGA